MFAGETAKDKETVLAIGSMGLFEIFLVELLLETGIAPELPLPSVLELLIMTIISDSRHSMFSQWRYLCLILLRVLDLRRDPSIVFDVEQNEIIKKFLLFGVEAPVHAQVAPEHIARMLYPFRGHVAASESPRVFIPCPLHGVEESDVIVALSGLNRSYIRPAATEKHQSVHVSSHYTGETGPWVSSREELSRGQAGRTSLLSVEKPFPVVTEAGQSPHVVVQFSTVAPEQIDLLPYRNHGRTFPGVRHGSDLESPFKQTFLDLFGF